MKKLITILLVLAMVLTLAPLAFASEEAGIEEELPQSDAEASDSSLGEGTLEEEPTASLSEGGGTAQAVTEGVNQETPVDEPAEAPALDGDTHSGICGTNVSWSLDTSTGVLTISGTGYMDDYESYDSMPWYSYRDSIKSVVIKDGVKSFGELAFFYHDAMTSVTIGNSVETIKDSAFQHSENLTSVTLGNSVKTIGQFAFQYCDIRSLTIPDSVVSIGDFAFYNNEYLTSVTLGNSVETIGQFAFQYCDIRSLTIPDSVTSIGEGAFLNNRNLKNATIPDSVTSIDEHAFGYLYIIGPSDDNEYEIVSVYTPIEGFTITGYPDSAAEDYAVENGFQFIALERTYTVTFITDYGTAPAAQTVKSGSTATKPADPVDPSGEHVFRFWGTKSTRYVNGQPRVVYNRFDFDKAITSDRTLYARWEAAPATPSGEKPTVTIASDGKTATVTGDWTGLYARVALVLDNNGVSGLYVTQATINDDGTIVIPAFMVPGLKVKGVNVAIVPTLADIQSTTPKAEAMATKMFT